MQSYKVTSITPETSDIRRIVLSASGGETPAWEAGAHVRVILPDGGTRAYSLLDLAGLEAGQIALGVLLEADSTGGSRFMHDLREGDQVELSEPANHFPLHDKPSPALLLAGGIGITPLLSMARALSAQGRAFALHYAGRNEQAMGFLPELKAMCGDALHLHFDDRPNALNIAALLDAHSPDTHLYICGPSGLIDAVKTQAAANGWPESHIHVELFTTDQTDAKNTPFELEIHETGQVLTVPADKTIIETLEEAGLDPLYDCQRGDCGICQCDVIDGIPDHRDVILTDAEKASNAVMQICVSRSKTPRLVIDL